MPLFKSRPTLQELQEQDEYLTTEVSVKKKQAAIKALEQRMGKGSWKIFSNNGKKSGISFDRIKNWLKTH
jgi:uncharacterized lipoprotein YehR (DUF1307 family)